MKILNLFAGIGGNRTLWRDKHEITAVEHNQQIALIYLKRFPNDTVIIRDAYEYFVKNFYKFDFVWASPPCQSHSWNTYGNVAYCYKKAPRKVQLPDMKLYSLIYFLKHQFRGDWIVENVKPYYEPPIKPTTIRGRHYYWSNKYIPNTTKETGSFGNFGTYEKIEITEKIARERSVDLELLESLSQYDRNQTLRNMIMAEEGLYLLNQITTKKEQKAIEKWF